MGSPVPQKQDVERWSVEHVAAWLQQVALTDCCEVFLRRGIDGRALLQLTEEGLVLWGRDVSIRNRKHIMKLVSQIKNQQASFSSNINSISNNSAISSAIKPKGSGGANGGFGRPSGSFAPHGNPTSQRHSVAPVGPPSHRPPPPPPPDDVNSFVDSFSSDEHDDDLQSQVHSSKEAHTKGVHPGDDLDDYTMTPVKNVTPTYPQAPQRVPINKPPAPPPTTSAASWLSKPPSNPPPAPPPVGVGKVGVGTSKMAGVRTSAALTKTSEHAKQNGVWNNGNKSQVTAKRSNELKPSSISTLPRPSGNNSIHSGSDDSTQDHHYEIVADPTSTGNSVPPALPPRNPGAGERVGVGAPTEAPPPLPEPPSRIATGAPSPPATVATTNTAPPKKPLPAQYDGPLETAPPPPGMHSTGPMLDMGDGETIEMTPLYLEIKDRSYFHPITRKESKRILENVPDGTFLMRPSRRMPNIPLTLCLRYSGKTYNINVRVKTDKTFALGTEKENESIFKSVDEIVSVHKIEYIKLESGKKVQLLSSPQKLR